MVLNVSFSLNTNSKRSKYSPFGKNISNVPDLRLKYVSRALSYIKISRSVFQTRNVCNICLSNIYLSIKYISTFSILLDVVAAMVLDLPFGVVAMLTGTAVIPLRRAVAAVEGNKISVTVIIR